MSKGNETPHILCVSTTLPTPGMGSSVIVYRHLKRLVDWRVSVLAYEQSIRPGYDIPMSWQIISMPKRPWGWPPGLRMGLSLSHLSVNLYSSKYLDILRRDRPTAVLNVFGKNSILACSLSRALDAPLSVILHDPWEVWVKRRNLIERYYMRRGWARIILDYASRIWPISRELADLYRLGGDKVSVLYPIPEGGKGGFAAWRNRFRTHPVFAFAGSFHPQQIGYFQTIATVLQRINGTLLLVTRRKKLFEAYLGKLLNVIVQEAFVENESLLEFLHENASCMLVPGSYVFNSTKPRLYETSFPSKLAEFSHLGLPIIINAPPNSALSRWARERHWQGFVDKLDVESLLSVFQKTTEKEGWSKMAEQSRYAALNYFRPDAIHDQFESELAKGNTAEPYSLAD